jgi:two-component system sensor histidine kinase BaeS
MDAMLDQLIEFSRLESGHAAGTTERVSLTELADECVEALGPLATSRRVRLVLEADGPATVTGSPLELSRLMRNLVDNAIRHSPDHGLVTIRIADDHTSVRFTVTDEGAGFPPEFRDRAFEPFERADPSRNARTGNTGLGLAISRAIVTAHGGTISLGEGPGGAVHVVLPATPQRSINPHSPTGVTS